MLLQNGDRDMDVAKVQTDAQQTRDTLGGHQRNPMPEVRHHRGDERVSLDACPVRDHSNVGKYSIETLRHQKYQQHDVAED